MLLEAYVAEPDASQPLIRLFPVCAISNVPTDPEILGGRSGWSSNRARIHFKTNLEQTGRITSKPDDFHINRTKTFTFQTYFN